MFRAALLVMLAIPTAKARDGRALALYYMSLLRGKQGRDAEARKLRAQAAAYPVSGAGWAQNGLFSYLMAEVLVDLGEHRRAILFCERSVQVFVEMNNPVAMAEVLWLLGRCYVRTGLRDHAAVPLRFCQAG